MTAVLGIVYRAISTHLIRKAGRTQATAQSGAVTLIQRFGSALNLNIHFHLLVLDGVYGRVNSHLSLDREDTALDSLLSHSITYRIALGPRAGQKAFTLQSLPGTSRREPDEPFLASADGFSLYAGVAAGADERKKVERLCRYIARPAIATGRLSLTSHGQVRYTLKTPDRDGTTHVVFEPLDFIARLAALVPRPRAHLTRYHGVFAPHSRWRAEVTPAGRGKPTTSDPRTSAERHQAMTWAQPLKRVFGIEIETCEACGGKVRVKAAVAGPASGRDRGSLSSQQSRFAPASRAPGWPAAPSSACGAQIQR